MHPQDAAARGIAQGDMVRIFNDRGSMQARARVTDKARVGLVVGLSIWWKKFAADGKNANEVTSQRLTDMGRAPTFYDVLVQVETAAAGRGRLSVMLRRGLALCAGHWRWQRRRVAACSTVSYYAQAAQGQFSLLAEARPLEDWLDDPATSPALKAKLQTVREIRRFASPNWACLITAATAATPRWTGPSCCGTWWPHRAVAETRQWCFPIAGCVDYRGYYSKQDAQAYAETRKEGYDVRWRRAGLFHAGLVQ
jgi:formylmethanofuran dehydrogenase subunit D